ncbi:MAG: ASKHA domain-containing protein [Spirochaetaceae bacterium]|nr:ASKHA domain-containing protein [Spirochaetaceae bacterium]
MTTIRVILAGKERQEIAAEPGMNLLKTLQAAGIYLPAICGGQGNCGKCMVRVFSGTLPVTVFDRDCFSELQLEEGYRLACVAFPVEEGQGDIGIEVFETGERHFSAVNDFKAEDDLPRALEETLFPLEKSPQSYAHRLAPDRRLGYSELREASKLADAQGRALGAPGEFRVYRERGRILRIGGTGEPIYAAAVDIGTTTLALALLDLRTGKIAGRFSAVNRQREFGGDVISRIERANTGDLPLLSLRVREQIARGISEVCQKASAEVRAIQKIAIVGNTTMLHLLLQLSCRTLGQTPFTPVTLDMVSLRSREIFEGDLSCEIMILPGISTYVGADITAGLLFAGVQTKTDPVVFMDIGTNGEMALAYKGKILCTATAAGPAFEGGNIRWGTGSVPGAISAVRLRDGIFACTTIGNQPPVGICGSAVVDIVYQGLKNDFILSSGAFNKSLLPAGEIFLAMTPDGRPIVFCQKDVRELQLAKSAIRSGLDALLNHAGLGYGDIKTLFLAGGFGFNLNLESSAGIGLIPEALRPKVILLGNSALGGAVKFLLNPDHENTLDKIVEQSEEFRLPTDRYFNDCFIDNINFEPSIIL